MMAATDGRGITFTITLYWDDSAMGSTYPSIYECQQLKKTKRSEARLANNYWGRKPRVHKAKWQRRVR